MIKISNFINNIIPERYKLHWIYLLNLKNIKKPLINNKKEFYNWLYIQKYSEKFLALMICAYYLNILEIINDNIILNGFNFYNTINSFEKEIFNILCNNKSFSIEIIPTKFHNLWHFLEARTNCDIYKSLILSLIKLNKLNNLNEIIIIYIINEDLENGGLEKEIFKLFNIHIDIII
jgi:hypothetical protein